MQKIHVNTNKFGHVSRAQIEASKFYVVKIRTLNFVPAYELTYRILGTPLDLTSISAPSLVSLAVIKKRPAIRTTTIDGRLQCVFEEIHMNFLLLISNFLSDNIQLLISNSYHNMLSRDFVLLLWSDDAKVQSLIKAYTIICI